MKVADAIAHILKAEGTEYLFAYPVNPLIEAAAKVGMVPFLFGDALKLVVAAGLMPLAWKAVQKLTGK